MRSVNGPDNCVVDCLGTEFDNCRGFDFNVDGATSQAVVDGFTITGGYLDSGTNVMGGGIRCAESHPTIRNCMITGNKASLGGGLGFTKSSTAVIENCTIKDNETISYNNGGGVYAKARGTKVEMTGCAILSNKAANGSGGGIYWGYGAKFIVADCVIVNNTAKRGGGIYAYEDDSLFVDDNSEIKRTTIVGNIATNGRGGGVSVTGSYARVRMVNCNITGNRALGDDGGGLAISGVASQDPAPNVWIVNALVAGNWARDGGGILLTDYVLDQTRVADSSVVGNLADSAGGGIRWSWTRSDSTQTGVYNGIVWGNAASSGAQISESRAGKLSVQYSDVQAGWSGIGNIGDEPLFLGGDTGTWTADATYDSTAVKTTFTDSNAQWINGERVGKLLNPDTSQYLQSVIVKNTNTTVTVWGNFKDLGGDGEVGEQYQINDYRLTDDSPCIDTANNNLVPADETDIDDNEDTAEPTPLDLDMAVRFFPADVDMGAYEYPGCPVATINVAASNPADGTIDARVPFTPPWNNSLERRRGIGGRYGAGSQIERITLALSPARSHAAKAVCWGLCETGIETIDPAYPQPPLEDNFVYSVVETSPGVYDILLDRPISAGHWTTISYLGGNDHVTYASLPGDADGNNTSEPPDILAVIDYLNGVSTSPWGIYSEDIDHSGDLYFVDIFAVIDLLNGVNAYTPWLNVPLPPNTCPGGESAMAMLPGPGISADDAFLDFIDGFVVYLTDTTISDREDAAEFELIVDSLTHFSLEWLSRRELDLLAEALVDPSVSYASPVAAAKTREVAIALTR